MRVLALVLVVLIAAIQTPLWFGQGGWMRVRELDRRLQALRETNDQQRANNTALEAEVHDLKQGSEAIEERARNELGMVRQDEVFFRIVESAPTPAR